MRQARTVDFLSCCHVRTPRRRMLKKPFLSSLWINFETWHEPLNKANQPNQKSKKSTLTSLILRFYVFLFYFLFISIVCFPWPCWTQLEGPKSPPLSVLFGVPSLHQQLVLGWGDGQALYIDSRYQPIQWGRLLNRQLADGRKKQANRNSLLQKLLICAEVFFRPHYSPTRKTQTAYVLFSPFLLCAKSIFINNKTIAATIFVNKLCQRASRHFIHTFFAIHTSWYASEPDFYSVYHIWDTGMLLLWRAGFFPP